VGKPVEGSPWDFVALSDREHGEEVPIFQGFWHVPAARGITRPLFSRKRRNPWCKRGADRDRGRSYVEASQDLGVHTSQLRDKPREKANVRCRFELTPLFNKETKHIAAS